MAIEAINAGGGIKGMGKIEPYSAMHSQRLTAETLKSKR